MTFASEHKPATWFVSVGNFFRWLCVYLFFANTADEFTDWMPEGYAQFTWNAMIGVAVALLFTLSEYAWLYFKRPRLTNLLKRHHLNQLAVRYFLGFILLGYGISKILDEQFHTLYTVFEKPLSAISGWQLAWRFFDYSYKYKLFIGLGQILGGLLLLNIRTALLGIIVSLPIMANIVFINFAFGIPVTFFSMCYLLFLVYLLLCDYDRLYLFFIRNQAVPSKDKPVRFSYLSKRSFRIVSNLFIAYITVQPIVSYLPGYLNDLENKPFVGVYRVTNFLINNQPVKADSLAWEKLYVDRYNIGVVKFAEGADRRSTLTFDNAHHQLKILFENPSDQDIYDSYNRGTDQAIYLKGRCGKDSIKMDLQFLYK